VEKSMYFAVDWAEAKKYSDALQALDVPYLLETPEEIPTLKPGQLAFVLPSLPIRVYVKVRTLFGRDGERY